MAQNTIHTTVVGRLAAAPEQRYTNDDQPLCHLQHRAVLCDSCLHDFRQRPSLDNRYFTRLRRPSTIS